MDKKTIGIDFGATNASVAILERNKAQVLLNSEGGEATPALVAEMPDGRRLVGQVVQRQLVIHADTTIGHLQSWLGRRFEHPQTATDSADAAYGVVSSPRGDAWLELCGHAVPPAELGATLLASLKSLAQDYLGSSADTAVVAVPASFHAAARRALLDAGNLAEFTKVHVLSSAVAAALTYARQLPEDSEPHTLAIFDWGGGACQVAIVRVAPSTCEVMTTCTDHGCGGEQDRSRAGGSFERGVRGYRAYRLAQGCDWLATGLAGRAGGQTLAVGRYVLRGQLALHRRGHRWPQAPGHHGDPRELRAAGRAMGEALPGALRSGLAGGRHRRQRHRCGPFWWAA